LCIIFYQINRDDKIQTRDRLVIKALIPCQKTISTQKLKLLGEDPEYDLYYFLTLYTRILLETKDKGNPIKKKKTRKHI
jgi:hypothetical protein